MSARAERVADATEDVWDLLTPTQRRVLLDHPAEGLQLVKDNLTACGFELDDDEAEEVFKQCSLSAMLDQVPSPRDTGPLADCDDSAAVIRADPDEEQEPDELF